MGKNGEGQNREIRSWESDPRYLELEYLKQRTANLLILSALKDFRRSKVVSLNALNNWRRSRLEQTTSPESRIAIEIAYEIKKCELEAASASETTTNNNTSPPAPVQRSNGDFRTFIEASQPKDPD